MPASRSRIQMGNKLGSVYRRLHIKHWAFNDYGYMFECDLEIDPNDHDRSDDLPPAAPKRCVEDEELSISYQRQLMDDLGIKNSCQKLVADLKNKKNFIVHHAAMQSYLKMGVKITKIHKVLSFRQEAWMAKYINYNTEKRKLANSEFEKNSYKLLNNAGFGKTIEQVRNRQNIHIVTSSEKAIKSIKKPTIQKIIHIDEHTTIMVMKRLTAHLDKPIASGVGIFDIAKSIMFDMHYQVMQPKYGDNMKMLYTDKDSFIHYIKTENVHEDMKQMSEHFDMSEYDPKHPLFAPYYDPTNKKVWPNLRRSLLLRSLHILLHSRPKFTV